MGSRARTRRAGQAARAADDRRHRVARDRNEPRAALVGRPRHRHRRAADDEAEIAVLESQLADLQEVLGRPETWRDPVAAVASQKRLDDGHESLRRLYEHWEEALELNG